MTKLWASSLLIIIAGCSPAKTGNAISCYVANQQICFEDPSPTAAQLDNLPVEMLERQR